MGERELSLMSLLYWPPFKPRGWEESTSHAWLAALELLAGLFNQTVVSYPASAFAEFYF